MSLLNIVTGSFSVATGEAAEVYFCPAGKTHAIVDLSFLRDDLTTSSLVGVALTTQSNPAALTSLDYLIDDIEPVGTQNAIELSKVIVGQGQRLFVKVFSGTGISVRMSGSEENNPLVLAAGRLAATAVAGTGQVQLFHNNLPNTAYSSVSISTYNVSSSSDAIIEMWVGNTASPGAQHKIMNARVPANETAIAENYTLAPGDRIYVRSSIVGSEFFVNGMTVSSI